jgi:GFO/IDH/MocA oxidoreductase family protein
MKNNYLNRRSFLGTTASALTLPTCLPAHVLGRNGATAPNDRVNIGIIGLGGRARDLTKTCKLVSEMQIVSLCDCLTPRQDDFIAKVGKDQNWSKYDDFRQMIEKENLDGVMVETTTHARAWVSVLALQAGMDTYIEKPMCLTIDEGRQMVKAARKYGRITQIGTQQRSMPINNWASDLVKDGALGKIKVVLAPNFVGPNLWPGGPEEKMPVGGKPGWWDIWTNQAEMRPYNKQLHGCWNHWADYDAGGRSFGVSGWGTHSYDQVQRALGTDETGPVEVVLEEPARILGTGKYEPLHANEDDTNKVYHMTTNVVGPRAKVRMKYADGTELRLHLDSDRGPGLGAIFVGSKGKLEINRNKIISNPQSLAQSADNPGPNKKAESQYHLENWVECIKTRDRCNADIEYGQRSSTLCLLVNIARGLGRVGERLKWDPVTERFTNCPEANQLLARERRPGYELPELG